MPQNRIEAILLERLCVLGGAVERPVEVTVIATTDNGIDITVRRDERAETIRSDWLVGCDGAHSLVRQATSVAFEGGACQESFVLADVRMEWPLPRDEVSLFLSPAGVVVVAPLPGERHRIVATIDKAPEHPDISFMQSITDARGPHEADTAIHEILWSARFRIQHRFTDTPLAGRILLCGDAATSTVLQVGRV